MIDYKLLPYIVKGLSMPHPSIRAAACKCARSLSRSVKNLRTSLMDAGIAEPLFDLLHDDDVDVQITASAALCNIILDFSPMKQIIIEKGVVARLVELTRSTNPTLRLNAVWGLKNMLFQTDIETKLNVLSAITWEGLFMYVLFSFRLINDSDFRIQEQALCLVRNVACGGVGVNVY